MFNSGVSDLIKNLKNESYIHGLALTGSRSTGFDSKKSDYDILCFVAKNNLNISVIHFNVGKDDIDLYILPKDSDINMIPHDRVYSIINSNILYEKSKTVSIIKDKISKYFNKGPRYNGEDNEWCVYHLHHMLNYCLRDLKEPELSFWINKTAYFALIYSNRFKNKWVSGEKNFFRDKDNIKMINILKKIYFSKNSKLKISYLKKMIEMSIFPVRRDIKSLMLKEYTHSNWPKNKKNKLSSMEIKLCHLLLGYNNYE